MQAFAATFFNVLRSELGNPEGNLFEGISLEYANKLWLSKSCDKKFLPEDTTLPDALCLELFKEMNSRCKTFSLCPKSDLHERVIAKVQQDFVNLVYTGPELHFGLENISSSFGVGPGASIGALSYDFYSKVFGGPLTCTNQVLYQLYRQSLSSHSSWQDAEISRSASFGVSECVGSRLSFVPKTSIISRSICTEPSLNMLFQKGIGSCIEDGLRRIFKIDLSFQPEINRKLARTGSIDGRFSTIDLSSASDSMSLELLSKLLPLDLLKWLLVSRSPRTTLPDGTIEELHMVSSMGNGFTFPLQTYLFSSIVVAAYREMGIKPSYDLRAPSNWGVFGDDIIVVKDAYDVVVDLLELFGFKVNADKSFNHGSFRESCGGDFLRGHEIRGVYLRSLSSDADVYSAINRLVRWSSRTGILVFSSISYLVGLLRNKPLYIPYLDGDSEGIKVSTPPECIKRLKSGAFQYKALETKVVSIRYPNSADSKRVYPKSVTRKKTEVFFNPSGLKLSLIAGFIRDERGSVRLSRPSFKVRKRTTFNWSGVVPFPDAKLCLEYLTSLDQGMGYGHKKCLFGASTSGFLSSPGRDWQVTADLYF